MRVEVTAEDIAEARKDLAARDWRMPAAYCPLARAINRELGTKPEAEVYVYEDNVCVNGSRYALPREARRFVSRFDADLDMEPAAFDLDLDNEIECDEDGEPLTAE